MGLYPVKRGERSFYARMAHVCAREVNNPRVIPCDTFKQQQRRSSGLKINDITIPLWQVQRQRETNKNVRNRSEEVCVR